MPGWLLINWGGAFGVRVPKVNGHLCVNLTTLRLTIPYNSSWPENENHILKNVCISTSHCSGSKNVTDERTKYCHDGDVYCPISILNLLFPFWPFESWVWTKYLESISRCRRLTVRSSVDPTCVYLEYLLKYRSYLRVSVNVYSTQMLPKRKLADAHLMMLIK